MKPSINEVTVYFLAFLIVPKLKTLTFLLNISHLVPFDFSIPLLHQIHWRRARHGTMNGWHICRASGAYPSSHLYGSILLLFVGTTNPSAISTSKYSQFWPNVLQHSDVLLACRAKWRWCRRCLISLQRSFGGIQRKH